MICIQVCRSELSMHPGHAQPDPGHAQAHKLSLLLKQHQVKWAVSKIHRLLIPCTCGLPAFEDQTAVLCMSPDTPVCRSGRQPGGLRSC